MTDLEANEWGAALCAFVIGLILIWIGTILQDILTLLEKKREGEKR